MSSDHAEDPALSRAAEWAGLGHQDPASVGDATLNALATAAREDPDARGRAAALAALVRLAPGRTAVAAQVLEVWSTTVADSAPAVRRRAADVAPALAGVALEVGLMSAPRSVATALIERLSDDDSTVVVAAAWALGELGLPTAGDAVQTLAALTTGSPDPTVREAVVAALGALGDPAGLPAILTACSDRPPIRRRAVLALAAFDGPEVDAALEAASTDRDWQVRQAAEDLRL
jgi:HEAT repeat protein